MIMVADSGIVIPYTQCCVCVYGCACAWGRACVGAQCVCVRVRVRAYVCMCLIDLFGDLGCVTACSGESVVTTHGDV